MPSPSTSGSKPEPALPGPRDGRRPRRGFPQVRNHRRGDADLPQSLTPWLLVAQRLGIALLTLLIVSFAVFFATEMLPGDVARDPARPGRDPRGRRRPARGDGPQRAGDPALPALARRARRTGDLGTSYVNNMPVAELIGGRLVNSLKLAGGHRRSLRCRSRSASASPRRCGAARLYDRVVSIADDLRSSRCRNSWSRPSRC